MEASLAHKKAIAISFPFNGWGSWTEDDIQTAVKVCVSAALVHFLHTVYANCTSIKAAAMKICEEKFNLHTAVPVPRSVCAAVAGKLEV